ncbi:MAG: sulfatase [Phycisphaerae bacterium]
MRILYIDMDACRADHLGCYGYSRQTSPTIDAIAAEGVIFSNCFVSDAPCLPSRTALMLGTFGYRSGCVGHSGTAARPRYMGDGHRWDPSRLPLPAVLATKAKHHTVTFSPFAERHSAWHFCAGWREIHNSGLRGYETADQTNALVEPWLQAHARQPDWFCHVNYWDPHRPYRTPAGYGNPFETEPPPAWPDAQAIAAQLASYGPRSAAEPLGWGQTPTPREVSAIRGVSDFKTWIDGYDTGIRYLDDHIARLIEILKRQGVYDETAIIISADHGEQQGELNVYGDHHCADLATGHVPLIIRWPGLTQPGRREGLLYQLDLAATICQLLGCDVPEAWDARSFADGLRGADWSGRDNLVLGQGAWTCQRAVRHGDYLLIRTYHSGLKPYGELMLFNVAEDPHETMDLASSRPDLVDRLSRIQLGWQAGFAAGSDAPTDPLIDVIREGGPCYVRGLRERYCDYLRQAGKGWAADEILARA